MQAGLSEACIGENLLADALGEIALNVFSDVGSTPTASTTNSQIPESHLNLL